AYEVTRAANALEAKNQSQNGSDGDDSHNGNGRNGNGENGNGRNENPNENNRDSRIIEACCPRVYLPRLHEVSTTQLQGNERSCRVDRVRTIGTEAAFAMSWRELMKLMAEVFQELTMMCTKMVPEEEDRLEKFIGGLPDNIQGNDCRVPDARGKTYVLGGGDANPCSNTVTGTFLLNDHHAYMLFDSGADICFVSNTFSALLDITPYALDVSYVVELADGRTSETNTMLRGCTLGLLGHPFNINLMPIDLGSFDVIIGMDWLAKNHAVIVCDEKIVCIPYGNEILIVQGDKSDKEKKLTLSIISCVKA
ncbi:reverse transcriptase domain-containing protein, partial [Tanacetum coccineum]